MLGTFRERSVRGNGAGSALFCIQGLFALSVQDLQVPGIWCAIHLYLCFPKLTGSFESQCVVGKPILEAFYSEFCFKS